MIARMASLDVGSGDKSTAESAVRGSVGLSLIPSFPRLLNVYHGALGLMGLDRSFSLFFSQERSSHSDAWSFLLCERDNMSAV